MHQQGPWYSAPKPSGHFSLKGVSLGGTGPEQRKSEIFMRERQPSRLAHEKSGKKTHDASCPASFISVMSGEVSVSMLGHSSREQARINKGADCCAFTQSRRVKAIMRRGCYLQVSTTDESSF